MKQLGFGLMRLPRSGGADWGGVDLEETKRMIDRFLEAGCTYFDTAHFYHEGKSEAIFGALVASRYPRASYVVTTKMPLIDITCAEDYPRIFAEQLSHCGVEYFDYYLLHALSGPRYAQVEEMGGFAFLRQKKAEGYVRHIGFSYHDDADTLERILTQHPETELVQLQLNYVDWDSHAVQSRRCYEVCCRHGVTVAVMEPLKGGRLAQPPAAALELLAAHNPGASAASWGLRFAAGLPGVLVVLSGMGTMEQLEDNLRCLDAPKPLTEEENTLIEKTVRIIRDSVAVACTECGYCVADCPQNIAIPKLFALRNDAAQYGKMDHMAQRYAGLTEKSGPLDCVGCGACEERCPQHLPIIEALRQTATVFAP